jgi:hypothetical protein
MPMSEKIGFMGMWRTSEIVPLNRAGHKLNPVLQFV